MDLKLEVLMDQTYLAQQGVTLSLPEAVTNLSLSFTLIDEDGKPAFSDRDRQISIYNSATMVTSTVTLLKQQSSLVIPSYAIATDSLSSNLVDLTFTVAGFTNSFVRKIALPFGNSFSIQGGNCYGSRSIIFLSQKNPLNIPALAPSPFQFGIYNESGTKIDELDYPAFYFSTLVKSNANFTPGTSFVIKNRADDSVVTTITITNSELCDSPE